MSDKDTRKVLLVTASVGSGHNQAAAAIADALTDIDCVVETLDIMDYLPFWFRWYYGGGYSLLVSKLAWLYGLGFWCFDRPNKPARTFGEKIRIWFEEFAAEKLVDRIDEISPDLIVHTHFLAPPILSGLDYENQLVVITDIMTHRWWYSENVKHWFVQQPRSAERLVQNWKISPEDVTISGMPVRKTFSVKHHDTPELRDELHLPRDKRIILLSGGTEFTCGPVVQIARDLAAIDGICVVTLGGRNKKLIGTLAGLDEVAQGKIVPMGFTDKISELMDIAELIITKPGGMICAECLAKDLPAVFLPPVPGQELDNAKFLEECSVATIAKTNSQLASVVSELLADKPRIDAMSKAAASLHRPAVEIIKQKISEYLSGL